jgi:hypothetical protein
MSQSPSKKRLTQVENNMQTQNLSLPFYKTLTLVLLCVNFFAKHKKANEFLLCPKIKQSNKLFQEK